MLSLLLNMLNLRCLWNNTRTEIPEFEEEGRVLGTWVIIKTMRDGLDRLRVYFGYILETWGP